MKSYIRVLSLICVFVIFSCNEDDSLSPLPVVANADIISLNQNNYVDIMVLLNDENVPSDGSLNWTSPNKGSLTRLDINDTPNNLSDDILRYTASPNEVGSDEFEYTICGNSDNCDTALVSITITSGNLVNFNLEAMPYQTLSEYGFFKGEMKNLEPSFGVLPYELNSSLFSDYAKKQRFVWMPNNTRASYVNDNVYLEFPVGTILIKNFYYNNVLPNDQTRIIETRLMIRKPEGWVFADYIWNEGQSEAIFDLSGSTINVQWLENGITNEVDYRVPSAAKCFTCHKIMEVAQPIGPKPRNLNRSYNYNDGEMNQLDKWVELGYLEDALPSTISKLPDYNDSSQSLETRVRAYLDINCAHCHSEETHCAYRPLRLDFSDTSDYTNMGVCVDPDEDIGQDLSHIIEPGDSRFSVLHFRISTTEPSTRMPLLGRSLTHSEGVALIEAWIDSLQTECN